MAVGRYSAKSVMSYKPRARGVVVVVVFRREPSFGPFPLLFFWRISRLSLFFFFLSVFTGASDLELRIKRRLGRIEVQPLRVVVCVVNERKIV